MAKTLGERLRELRGEGDLSLRELGRRLDVSAAHLSDIELGRRYPSDELLEKLARALGTSSEALRAYDTRPPVEELKRMAADNPAFGLALRKAVDRMSPEELTKLMEQEEGEDNSSD